MFGVMAGMCPQRVRERTRDGGLPGRHEDSVSWTRFIRLMMSLFIIIKKVGGLNPGCPHVLGRDTEPWGGSNAEDRISHWD